MPRIPVQNRALSHNVETERSLLGGMITAPQLVAEVAQIVSAPDFAVPSHQVVYRVLCDLAQRAEYGDVVALTDELDRRQLMAGAGGVSAVMALTNACPSVAGLVGCAQRVRDHADRRRLQSAAQAAREMLNDGSISTAAAADYLGDRVAAVRQRLDAQTPAALLARWHVSAALERFHDQAAPVPVGPLPGGYAKVRQETRHASELDPERPGESGGWPSLARLLGAWWNDSVAVLVGHTGRGKSSLALQMAETVAREGAPVLYASMEMGTDELAARLIALRGREGAAWSALKRGAYTPEATRLSGARLVADCAHLYLWAPGPEGRNPEALQRMARAVSAVAGGHPPFVVLDYVQRLATPAGGAATEDRRGAVSDLSGRLRDLSRPRGLGDDWPGAAVLALSSTGRSNYEALGSTAALEKATELEGSGKESGELEYDAPVLLCMASDRPREGEPEPRGGRAALVRVVKNREGSQGSCWMLFDAARGRFVEAPRAPGMEPQERAHRSAAAPGRRSGVARVGRGAPAGGDDHYGPGD